MNQSLMVQNQVPKSVTIEKGKWYNLTDGKSVQITAIRTNGVETTVYYRYRDTYRSKWYNPSWNISSYTLEQFKSVLLDLGGIQKLTLNPINSNNA